MNLVSGIIDSGFFAQSALSAEVATKDSLGRNISETYLTGIPADYATTNYVDSSVSGKYDTSSFSAISGEFLTAVPADYATTAWVTGQGYLTAHQALPQSANWDSTYDTVSNNSASWTGGAGGGLPMAIGDSAVFNSGYEMNNEYRPSLYLSGNMYNYPLLQVRGGYNTEGASGALRSNYISFHTGYTTGTNTYQVLRLDRDGLTGKATNYTDWYFRPYEYGLLTGTYDTVSNNSASWGGGSTYTGDAQGALDEVYSNSGTWNSTTDTVSSNSGAWGGSGIEISAGFGIDIQLVDNKLVISLATATGDI